MGRAVLLPGRLHLRLSDGTSELADTYAEFKAEGAEVISVSTDTVFTHKAWHDTSPTIKKIDFPMAGDPTGSLSRMFGTYIDAEGLSLRGSFVIDPDGHLKAAEIHDNSIGRSAASCSARSRPQSSSAKTAAKSAPPVGTRARKHSNPASSWSARSNEQELGHSVR